MKSLLELCCDKTQLLRHLWPLDVKRRIPMNNVQGMINYYEDLEIHGDLYGGWVTGVNAILYMFPFRRAPNERCYLRWYHDWFMSLDPIDYP